MQYLYIHDSVSNVLLYNLFVSHEKVIDNRLNEALTDK
jgi:hypothetical protein